MMYQKLRVLSKNIFEDVYDHQGKLDFQESKYLKEFEEFIYNNCECLKINFYP